MFHFIWGIFVGIFETFLFGGFIILGFKLYEWWGDRFYVKKVGKYLSKKKTTTVELILPDGMSNNIADMEAFFAESSVISGNRSSAEVMNLGKWFFQLCFDIVSVGGEVKMYLSSEKARMEFVKPLLLKHYPDLIIKDAEWPYKDFPEEWWNEDGVMGFKGFRGNEMTLGKSQIHPLRSYKEFYSNDGRLVSDPMETLFTYLRSIPKDSIMVVQYHLRPWPAVDSKKKWKKDLDALREELANNSVVEKRGTSIVSITTEEEKILDSSRLKISKPHYRSKIRWFVLHDDKSKSLDPSIAAKGISAYLQFFETSNQKLTALKEMNTDAKAESGKYGALDGIITQKINDIYWMTRQKEYTMRRLYNAVRNRDGGFNGNDDILLSSEDLAGLIHFPIRKFSQSQIIKQNQNKNIDQNQSGVVIQQYQPAYYIQQDSSTVSLDNKIDQDKLSLIDDKKQKAKPPADLPS